MTLAPVLKRPSCGKTSEFVISTDASKIGLGAVLLQADSQNKLQSCANFAKSLTDSQRSYSTYNNQELLVIVAAMAEWRVPRPAAPRPARTPRPPPWSPPPPATGPDGPCRPAG